MRFVAWVLLKRLGHQASDTNQHICLPPGETRTSRAATFFDESFPLKNRDG